ncbi:ABC transporter permease [Paenibacillus sp. LHD-117]|uniref:ABC transporter permease n=1 Tax=Paenibacillus sp. LHD-117 TaxID=3071412 RepID=UPI0027DEE537|nr:ABC transporter permease [Paenibacillus sp. LHD-117]MDQ6419456.1 ABC transporter permease [Paenibacillus sp. LHD-117]
MNGWTYIWTNLKHRSFLAALTIIAVAVTVALFALMLMSRDGVEEGAQKGYGPFELVIGADGSESQLVLNTFYRVGAPTGNIPYGLLEEAEESEHTDAAFGMTTGDSHEGYPIVGIDPAYFLTRYADRQLAEGKLYAGLDEVTVGYAVANALNLRIGDTFSGAHGLVEHVELEHEEEQAVEEHEGEAHSEGAGEEAAHEGEEHADEAQEGESHDAHASFKYTVVGILPKLNTADDRAIFTTMDYAWAVHEMDEAHKEITAIIVKPSTLLGVQSLKTQFDAHNNVQAVYTGKAVADVLNVVDTGSQLLLIVMFVCVLLAAVTLLLALTASIQERKRDVGLLRLIGKSRSYILLRLIGEGLALTAIGLLIGLIAGHGAGALMSESLFEQTGIQLQALRIASEEWLLIAATIAIGTAASIGPALGVYRTDALTLFRE